MFLNYLSENIILPVSDKLTGYSIYSKLKFLKTSQYWTRAQIDEYQNIRLRLLIYHAYKNVPFYKELFQDLRLKPEDIQTKEDLAKLPIITKEDLKKNKSKHLASNIHKKDLILTSSSGSTGEPFQFYSTKDAESMVKAIAIRSWYWMGYCLGDKYVKVSMNPRTSFLKKIQDLLNNSIYLSSNQLIESNFSKIAEEIQKNNPKFIRCYPVPLAFLAQQIKNNKKLYSGKALKAINTTGSTLHINVRKEIENIFGVKIFDSYSCEGGTVFAQCQSLDNYHPAEEYAISEYITDNFTNSDSDKSYRHITTDLHNYASPFIRYDTQDYIVLGDNQKCSCGKEFLNIKQIKGRDSDILRTPSGKFLIVENFVAYFEWITEVDQIQVVQNEPDEIIIKMIVNESFTPEINMKINKYWKNYIGDDVRVITEIVDEIKLTSSGKRRTLIRNPKINLNH